MAELVDRVTTNLQSTRVLLTLAGIAVVALGVLWAARRRGARWRVAVGAAAVPVLVASAVLAAPYFRQRELVEALPGPAASITEPAPSTSGASSGPAIGRVRSAPLRGLGGHSARGTVELHRLADGSHVVRFEQVDIEGTPTPRVYVVPGADRERPGGAKLGGLKAERGSFNYVVDEPTGTVTILVWCERFAVPIAGATLA
jgi:hypothetical protein